MHNTADIEVFARRRHRSASGEVRRRRKHILVRRVAIAAEVEIVEVVEVSKVAIHFGEQVDGGLVQVESQHAHDSCKLFSRDVASVDLVHIMEERPHENPAGPHPAADLLLQVTYLVHHTGREGHPVAPRRSCRVRVGQLALHQRILLEASQHKGAVDVRAKIGITEAPVLRAVLHHEILEVCLLDFFPYVQDSEDRLQLADSAEALPESVEVLEVLAQTHTLFNNLRTNLVHCAQVAVCPLVAMWLGGEPAVMKLNVLLVFHRLGDVTMHHRKVDVSSVGPIALHQHAHFLLTKLFLEREKTHKLADSHLAAVRHTWGNGSILKAAQEDNAARLAQHSNLLERVRCPRLHVVRLRQSERQR
mmetsp:Transcript_57726/g.160935  ORF Transcript_57726/g.160935 Transcript_57726/m.160935 type:complete len:362 (+) Transcript_57726:88-1173(+)